MWSSGRVGGAFGRGRVGGAFGRGALGGDMVGVCCLALIWALGCADGVSGVPENPADDASVASEGGADVVGPADAESTDLRVIEDVCAPRCSLAECGSDDGCGGLCAPCPAAVSCADCALRLTLVAAQREGAVTRRILLALVFDPPEGALGPTSAEIRMRIDGPAKVLALTPGAPLAAAEKVLPGDSRTGRPYQRDEPGMVRVVVLSTASYLPVGAGTWWTLEVLLGAPFEAPTGPVVFRLIREGEPLFAPPQADAVVMDPRTLDPVSVWPDVPLPGLPELP